MDNAEAKQTCPTAPELTTLDLLGALEQMEKNLHETYWRAEQRISELSARVEVIESGREREFQNELRRRTQPQMEGVDPCAVGVKGDSLAARLRRQRGL